MGRPRIPPVERVCVICGSTFLRPRHRHEQSCSKVCAGIQSARTKDERYGPGWFSGSNNPRFNNGLCLTKEHRTLICCRDGSCVFFYRAVMEDHLGRPLTPDEIVHHIDGDPSNDAIENLEITTRSEHIGIHRHELMVAQGRAA